MNEVYVVTFLEIFEDRTYGKCLSRSSVKVQSIPAHVGNVKVCRNHTFYRSYFSGNQTKPFMLAVFKRFIKKHLHPEADTEKRLSGSSLLFHEIKEAFASQLLNSIPESANARKDNLICGGDDTLI